MSHIILMKEKNQKSKIQNKKKQDKTFKYVKFKKHIHNNIHFVIAQNKSKK